MMIHSRSTSDQSISIGDLQSPLPKSNTNEASSRQLYVSPSYSTDCTCPMDYSSENDLGLLPISPVSPDQDEAFFTQDQCEYDVADPCDIPKGKSVEENENESTSNHFAKAINSDVDNQVTIPTEVPSRPWQQLSDCNKRNSKGESPLSISSSSCFLKGMELLIEKGADVNLLDVYGRSPLHLVCEKADTDGHHSCVKLLLGKGANPHLYDIFGRTPLHIAAKFGCVQCINLLLDYGARTDIKDSEGDTALHIAASVGNYEIMCALSPACCDESHSSVESVTPSILDHDNVDFSYSRSFGEDAAGTSFYQSPRQNDSFGSRRIQHDNDNGGKPFSFVKVEENLWSGSTGITDRWSHSNDHQLSRNQNDSGYFTAKGSAWTKCKYYYGSNPIREERESVGSSSWSNGSAKYEVRHSVKSETVSSDSSSHEMERIELASKKLLEQVLEFPLRVVVYLISLLFMPKRHMFEVPKGDSLTRSSMKSNDDKFRFARPPDHVADAMERLKLSRQHESLCNLHDRR